MFLLGEVASPELKERFWARMVDGTMRTAFFMIESAEDGGAGSCV